MRSGIARLCAGTALAVAMHWPLAAAAQDAGEVLRTAPEKTDFVETTRYTDVLAFVRAAATASPRIHLDTMGYTLEGRALPLVVVGNLPDGSPEAVLASGRTRVYLQGNIHGGEVEGKESLLMLLRAFSEGRHAQLLDSLVLLVVPIYNADGNERVRLTNRGAQHGPIGGMGQRANAQDYDLNRDHMKLDSPEARSLALMLQRYDPHVGVDLHTTNGTRHGYHLTYAVPMHPNTDSALVRFMRQRWIPAVTEAVKEKHGWDSYYYGNLQGQGGDRGWYTFDYRPRFNNNYLGLRNRMGILSEAYSYATFEDRIRATSWFVEEVLDFAYRNAGTIRSIVAAADAAPLAGRELAVRADYERTGPVDILLGEVDEVRNPYSGEVMLLRRDVQNPQRMPEFGTYVPTETTRAPRAYLVPPALTEVLDRLTAHGVRATPLAAARELTVERFRIDSTTVAQRPFQGHQERALYGVYEAATVTVPAGTLVVPVEQPLGRLVFTLLEPRSADGLLNWNVLDRSLEGVTHYPILRTDADVR
jgi:hypothetical protein